MSDELKTTQDAAEKTAKIMHDIETDVKTNQQRIAEINETLGDMKKTLDGTEYVKTSEWQSKWDKIKEELNALDETVRKVTGQKMAVDQLGGGDEETMEIFLKNLRYIGLEKFGSQNQGKFKLTEAEQEKLDSKFLFGGQQKLPSVGWQTKDLLTSSTPSMGAWVAMPEMLNTIINQAVHEFSPMRRLATRRTTGSNLYVIPTKTARGVSYWVGEGATRTEDTTLKGGVEKIPIHEMALIVQASQELLEDAFTDIKSELTSEYMEAQLVLEGTALTIGNGNLKPQGIMSHPSLSSVNQGHATLIQNFTQIIQLPTLVKKNYLRSASFMMKRATLGKLRAIVGGDGHPLPYVERIPGTNEFLLDGFPIELNPDMPAIGAGLKPILFGDIGQAYLVIDKVTGQRMIVDIYSNKETGLVDFYYSKRVGGQAINIEAVYALNISA
jgi:HK97 family phage major capsid protein